jgi:hypothetical protein
MLLEHAASSQPPKKKFLESVRVDDVNVSLLAASLFGSNELLAELPFWVDHQR